MIILWGFLEGNSKKLGGWKLDNLSTTSEENANKFSLLHNNHKLPIVYRGSRFVHAIHALGITNQESTENTTTTISTYYL